MSVSGRESSDQLDRDHQSVFRFADFEVDTSCGQLRHGGKIVRVRNQSFDLLVLLLRDRPNLVTRDRIRDELWHDVNVEFAAGINSVMRDLRRTLADDARQPRFIETVAGRGYRFMAEAAEVRGSAASPAGPVRPLRVRFRGAIAIAIAAVFLLAIGITSVSRFGSAPALAPRTLLVLPFEVRDPVHEAGHLSRSIAEAVAVTLSGAWNLTVFAVPDSEPKLADDPYPAIARARDLGAGRVLTGSIGEADIGLAVQVQLLDTESKQILWGAHKNLRYGDVPQLAAILADSVAVAMGSSLPRRFEYFRYARGSEQMAGSPELDAAIGAFAKRPLGGVGVLQATERLLDTYPDDPEAHLLRLHALVDHHNHRFTPESEALLRDGLRDLERVDPDNPNLEILRGMSREFYPERPAAALQERVEQCLARTDLSPALRAFALRASARHHLHVTEDADEALDCLEEASSLDPANAWTFCYLADTYYRVGRIPESIHAARIALALSPDNYSSELLAQALGAAGRWAEAAEILGRFYAQERKQRSAGWYAFTLHRAGNPRPAYEVALEAEDIPTESPDEIISGALPLAAYWAAAGNPERAQRHLRTLCQHESMNIAADMVRLAPELAASPLCAAIIENCEAE